MWPSIPQEKDQSRNPHKQAQALLKIKPTPAQRQMNLVKYEEYKHDWSMAWYRTMKLLPNRDRDAYTLLLSFDADRMQGKVIQGAAFGLLLAVALYLASIYLTPTLPVEVRASLALLVGLGRVLATYQSEVAVYVEQGQVVHAQVGLRGIQWKDRAA
ncbi:hypothetical protein [Deinococcus ficus]|uniref:Uncharacterized protein n=1 Tax=Deinococcus ficus TaxID=317577 RepID=A0A221T2Q2_9DEIO|nr:hypothetical protein [Deinococcus ficus]ASN83173.1 hypothetical protein DFI_18405 [Deinococcus ficus]